MTQSRKKQTTTNTPPKTTTTSSTNTKFFLVMTKTFRARGGFTVPEELSWEIDVRAVTKDGYLRNGAVIPPEYFKIKEETIKRTEETTRSFEAAPAPSTRRVETIKRIEETTRTEEEHQFPTKLSWTVFFTHYLI